MSTWVTSYHIFSARMHLRIVWGLSREIFLLLMEKAENSLQKVLVCVHNINHPELHTQKYIKNENSNI